MKKVILIVSTLLLLFTQQTFSQTPDWLWTKEFGGGWNDESYAISIDAAGNVYTTGEFSDSVDFDPGRGIFNLTASGSNDREIFVLKLDASNNFIWAKHMTGTGGGFGMALSLDRSGSNAVYITGYFQNTIDFDPRPGVFQFNFR